MKKIGKYLIIIVMMLGLFITPLTARGLDFGDFSGDSDFGGGWDSGDSGWDSGWDSGDSWDSGGSYSGGSSGGGGGIVVLFMLFVVGYIIIASLRDSSKYSHSEKAYKYLEQTEKSEPYLKKANEYLNIDPSFSPSKFEEKAANLYVRFQNAWQSKDISSVRPYMTDTFYGQMDTQLNRYRMNNQTNCIERIAVLKSQIRGWRQEGGMDMMIVSLDTRIVDYVKDDRTGAILRGSNIAEKFMSYEWTFVRSTGVTTSRSTGTTAQTCPHCGAKIDMNQSAVCEYCGSVLKSGTFDWAVNNIRAISQRTGRR